MQSMLETLDRAYDYRVDIEFTRQLQSTSAISASTGCSAGHFQVKRPHRKGRGAREGHRRGEGECSTPRAGVVGNSRVLPLDRIIYVVPEAYKGLSLQERYNLARMVGRIAHCGRTRASPCPS
jgi:hypothetical protein